MYPQQPTVFCIQFCRLRTYSTIVEYVVEYVECVEYVEYYYYSTTYSTYYVLYYVLALLYDGSSATRETPNSTRRSSSTPSASPSFSLSGNPYEYDFSPFSVVRILLCLCLCLLLQHCNARLCVPELLLQGGCSVVVLGRYIVRRTPPAAAHTRRASCRLIVARPRDSTQQLLYLEHEPRLISKAIELQLIIVEQGHRRCSLLDLQRRASTTCSPTNLDVVAALAHNGERPPAVGDVQCRVSPRDAHATGSDD